MDRDLLSWLEGEIGRLRLLHAGFLRERAEVEELQAQWVLHGNVLLWHVVLEDVVEPDVDVEMVSEAFVVRACPMSKRVGLLVGLLPVPSGFDIGQAQIRCEEDYLEIRVRRSEGGGR